MSDNVIVIGSGGREHSIVCSLLKSPRLEKIFVIPGNSGTHGILGRTFNVQDIQENEHDKILKFAQNNDVSLVIVGPEGPLSCGIADFLEEAGIKVFGPRKEAANLEASKIFMKDVLVKAGIPTAKYKVFDKSELLEALKFLDEFHGKSIVIKADGLAHGKGVVVTGDITEARDEVTHFLGGKFGSSSSKIVIEEFLDGREVSLFAITDGKSVMSFTSACDHKRIFENDLGPNTGGMGTFSPSFLTKEEEEQYTEDLIKPVILELQKRGIVYKGVLFAGLMMCESGPKVLEFNIRFGDPEAQSILPRFEGDLYELMLLTANSKLAGFKAKFIPMHAVTIVLASKNYPASSSAGEEVSFPLTLPKNNFIFHAGAKISEGKIVTNGGRVLGITSLAKTKSEARLMAYGLVSKVAFNGMQFRKDIAEDLVSLDINFEDERWKEVGIGFYDFFIRLAKITMKVHFEMGSLSIKDSTKLYEFSVLLCNDIKMQELNKTFRNIDKPTNVLSFPMLERQGANTILMGDIAISFDTMVREAAEQSKSLNEHLAHLFAHSILHLMGYDHVKPREQEKMESLEDIILERAGYYLLHNLDNSQSSC